ncbi:MAG: exopolysaccharide biosynthesis protein [Rhodobacteraceae bacterium]|nr:exopolysaccharide biosynthesis protein [Paracoccaceae bacterium]
MTDQAHPMRAPQAGATDASTALPSAVPDTASATAPVEAVLDRACTAMERDEVTVDQLVGSLGRASFQPLLMLPALAVVTPLSGIPLFSSACGLMIFMVAVQMLTGRSHVHVPRWLGRRTVRPGRLRSAFETLQTAAQWIDRHSAPRLQILVRPPFSKLSQAFCALAGLTMPLLEFVPLTSSLLGAVVALLSVSMLTRDGLLTLAAAGVFLVLGAGVLSALAMV